MADSASQELQASVLRACELQPQGITDKDICKKLPGDIIPRVRLNAYNDLLKSGRLRLASRTGPDGKQVVLYQWVSAKEAEKFKGLNAAERMVYDLVEKAGHNGLTKRDLKFRTNIVNSSELKQMVECLVSRGLIKEVKSVQGTNKRVYIISELEPSTMHTGGPWYNDDQDFDNEFIEAIYDQIHAYMKTTEFVTVEQVTNYVAEIKLSNEDLSQSDLRHLMTAMLYDGVIEESEGAEDGAEYFRLAPPTPTVNHLRNIPCVTCPLFRDCTPDGVISPGNCVYMTEWLKGAEAW